MVLQHFDTDPSWKTFIFAVASWLVRLSPDRALAGDIVLCSWAYDT